MVRDQLREAASTEVDRVEWLEDLQAVLRHHPAVLQIVAAAPGERFELDPDVAVYFLGRADHLDAGLNDVLADAIAGDRRDGVRPHHGPPVSVSRRAFTARVGA